MTTKDKFIKEKHGFKMIERILPGNNHQSAAIIKYIVTQPQPHEEQIFTTQTEAEVFFKKKTGV